MLVNRRPTEMLAISSLYFFVSNKPFFFLSNCSQLERKKQRIELESTNKKITN